jgi:hypothetical protein
MTNGGVVGLIVLKTRGEVDGKRIKRNEIGNKKI